MTREELLSHLRWHYPVVFRRKRYLIAAMPKSGSTYAAKFFAALTDATLGFGGQIPGRNEQDIAPFWIWRRQRANLVTHMHCWYHPQTQVYIDHFDMQPIVCVRNLADIIPSVVDHWRKNATPDGASWPFAHVHPHLMQRDDEELYEFAAVHVLPWYVNFYVSWRRSRYTKRFLAYEDVFAPGHSGLIALARRFGFDGAQAAQALRIADGQDTRKNVGVPGRGRNLPPRVIEKVHEAIRYYPDIDWSSVWDM